MKKLIVAALALVAVSAQAQMVETDARPALVCGLEFQGRSHGAQFIVGRFHTEATGTLKCTDLIGGVYERPVRIEMGTHFLAPAVGLGDFQIAGVSGEISLFNAQPEVLFGKYAIAQGQAALIGGVGSFTAVKIGAPQIALQVSVQLMEGLGLHLGFHEMTIEPLN